MRDLLFWFASPKLSRRLCPYVVFPCEGNRVTNYSSSSSSSSSSWGTSNRVPLCVCVEILFRLLLSLPVIITEMLMRFYFWNIMIYTRLCALEGSRERSSGKNGARALKFYRARVLGLATLSCSFRYVCMIVGARAWALHCSCNKSKLATKDTLETERVEDELRSLWILSFYTSRVAE